MMAVELWMLPIGILLTVVGLVAAGYVWGLSVDIKQRLTNSTGDTDE